MMDRDGDRRARGGRRDHGEDAFIERIAKPLRAEEKLDATFEVRVMSAVHAEVRAGRAAGRRARPAPIEWWLRKRTLRFSPLQALAAAAACVALAWFGGRVLAPATGGASGAGASAGSDTVHVVRFVLIDPAAVSVSLVGDFNAWEKGATRLDAAGNGAWVASIPLPAGRHEYAFIVDRPDGEQWMADPFARTVHDEFDTESSVIMVGYGTSMVDRSSS